MIIVLIGISFLFFITVITYFQTTPEHLSKRSRITFNFFVFALTLLGCLMVYAYTYLNNGLSIERAMLSLLAYLQSLLVISIVLIVGGLFRNFIMFRGKK